MASDDGNLSSLSNEIKILSLQISSVHLRCLLTVESNILSFGAKFLVRFDVDPVR